MGRFQRSERGGGQPDPQEALRRAREAVARERAQRGEQHDGEEDERVDDVEEAMRERDEKHADDE
jgi:hypothetical protein